MQITRTPVKPGFFYGYWIVAATFFVVFVHSGCGFFAFSLFVNPLQADMGWSRGAIMAGFTAYYLAIAATAPFVGRMVDRYGARRVILAGALTAAAGFILLSQMKEIWQFYVSYAVVGLGLTGVSFIPGSAVISNWFKKRRGLAIGIMSTGIGVSALVLAPIIGGQVIPKYGWSIGYIALAIITCVIIIPLAWFVIKTKPSEMGLYPDGAQAPDVVSTSTPHLTGGLTLKMALATSAFWLIGVSFSASTFSQVGVIQNQVPHLEDIGFPVTIAAGALGGVGLGSAIGKFVFGWLCDHIPPKYACMIGLFLQLAGVIVILNIGSESTLSIVWLYAIIMGLGVGSWLPTMSMLTSTSFGLSSYGAVFGVITVSQSLGTAVGPLVAGLLYDAMHTYQRAFFIFLALYAISIPAVLLVKRPKSYKI